MAQVFELTADRSTHPGTRTQRRRHTALVAYLQVKLEESDWHGVSDAANDLRVLEAQMRLTESDGDQPEGQ